MYRRILVASDFSASATAGARLARSLAAPDASFLAVHVFALPTSIAFPSPALGLDPIPALGWNQALREGEAGAPDQGRLRGRLQEWIQETGVPGVDGVVAEGDVPRAIQKEAGDFAADLVVLGNRGHSRLDEVLVGSTARDVLRQARADVLLADERSAAHGTPRRIAVATSFDEASRAAARRALAIADATGADLLLLHAMGPGVQTGASYGISPAAPPLREETREVEEGVDAQLDAFNRQELGGRATVLRGRGPLVHELTRLAHEGHADLLVVGHHHAGFFERLLLGSVAEAFVRHPPCSTLFVQE
jgi:nucleotide-binding universal stress UspA family protein